MRQVTPITLIKTILFRSGTIVLVSGMIGYKAWTINQAIDQPQVAISNEIGDRDAVATTPTD